MLIVGGAVRDCILGKKPEEFDICTTATPEEILESFEDTIRTGFDYGTITVKSGNSLFEVTTLRTETAKETVEGPISSSLAQV